MDGGERRYDGDAEILTTMTTTTRTTTQGDKPTNDGEMNENATRGRNVPGGMKEGTAVRRERFSMDDARSARGREGKLTDARPTRRFAR